MGKFRFRWWYLVIIIPLLLIAGFLIWALTPLGPMPEALAALESSESVVVEQDQWYVFKPLEGEPETGLILYPGGRVDPRSYAPAAHAIASEGYQVVIVPMPLNLAVLGAGRAADVMEAYPEIEDWAVGGHSLGGSMAANYAAGSTETVDGLVLWAAYPASGDDLSRSEITVTSIQGALDGLVSDEDIAGTQYLLPPNVVWALIQGGNHAQFGWYGDQSGDNPAEISREDQQQQIIQATLALLENLR